MRRTGTLVLIALFLVACGSDDGGGDAGRSTSRPALSATEAKAIVDRALLDAADLGEGWELAGTEAPDAGDDSEEDDELEACMGRDFDLEEETIAESETRTFERSVSAAAQQQLVVSSGALESTAVVDDLFGAIASEQFVQCLTESFQEQLAAEGNAETELGEIEIEQNYAGAGDRSVRLRAPVTASVGGITLETRFDVVSVATGPVTTLFAVVSLGEHVPDDQLAGWARLVAQRQAA